MIVPFVNVFNRLVIENQQAPDKNVFKAKKLKAESAMHTQASDLSLVGMIRQEDDKKREEFIYKIVTEVYRVRISFQSILP
ncbi:MAG TPA: hypothetical protein DIT07_05630 [Sphingobacteriaceae bacterium]|nr:hypothetical protein [Sphingobacteriaceae bacterium]